MKNVSKALGSATVVCALAACGGSSGDLINSQLTADDASSSLLSTAGSLARDDASQAVSVSLTGQVNAAASHDLSIKNALIAADGDSTDSVGFEFEIVDGGGAEINLNDLSVALEIAASGSFADGFRQPLFDIRQNGSSDAGGLSLTARGANVDVPAGSYSARLVVNPNWQNSFDIVPVDRDQSQPFHFIAERDYSNNASNTFAISVQSTVNCSEDGFEDNDSVATATTIPVGGQIAASLCTDAVDFYSIGLAAGESTSIYFDYADTQGNVNQASKYVLLDSNFKSIGGAVARESNDIKVNATVAGTYYLAVYGARSTYQLTREPSLGGAFPENFSNDFVNNEFFTSEAVAGPQSWLLGDIALNKLVFTESGLVGQVMNCGRITTQFRDDQPVAYVTPDHFADDYKFHFLAGGEYVVDGEQFAGWGVQNGDIFNDHWYTHDYPGYAQITGAHDWRYWSADGLSYVDCAIEVN